MSQDREYLSPRADEKVRKTAEEVPATADGLYDVVDNQITAETEFAAETRHATADGLFEVKDHVE